jgi:hypothetical protein
MRYLFLTSICIFLFVSIGYSLINGVWDASFDHRGVKYSKRLDSTPVWSHPDVPDKRALAQRFSLRRAWLGEVRVVVRHDWGAWLTRLLFIWLLGALVISPASFIFFAQDALIGTIGRVGAGLILSCLGSLVWWILVGGWTVPVPLLLGTGGLILGSLWSAWFLWDRGSEQTRK